MSSASGGVAAGDVWGPWAGELRDRLREARTPGDRMTMLENALRQVLDRLERGSAVDWAHVAADGGYADQSHLTREFRNFTGLSPAAFLTRPRPPSNHVAVD